MYDERNQITLLSSSYSDASPNEDLMKTIALTGFTEVGTFHNCITCLVRIPLKAVYLKATKQPELPLRIYRAVGTLGPVSAQPVNGHMFVPL